MRHASVPHPLTTRRPPLQEHPFAELLTSASVNLYAFLASRGVPTAHVAQMTATKLVTSDIDRLPVSVSVYYAARGEYVRRHRVPEGSEIVPPQVEFRLSCGTTWRNKHLDFADPVIELNAGRVQLFAPDRPATRPFLELIKEDDPCCGRTQAYGEMARLAMLAGGLIESAVQQAEDRLHSITFRFGYSRERLVIADGLNPDAWTTRNRADGVRFRQKNDLSEHNGRTDYQAALDLTKRIRAL